MATTFAYEIGVSAAPLFSTLLIMDKMSLLEIKATHTCVLSSAYVKLEQKKTEIVISSPDWILMQCCWSFH